MGFFDQAYDEMSWKEVCYRLPSELAINALKRRITNLETIKMFVENVGSQPANIVALKDHVNDIISNEDVENILDVFEDKFHPVLFNWLSKNNSTRIKDHDPSKLSTKFLFNLTNSSDRSGLQEVFKRVLDEDASPSKIRAVLRKADDVCMPPLLNILMRDSRPEVRACLLCVPGLTNSELVTDHQKVIGLKAMAKCDRHIDFGYTNKLSINVFSALKPKERLEALERYLSFFPVYKRVEAFDPSPSDDEFRMILFAGCVEYNEEVNKINEKYNLIVNTDPPGEEEMDDTI
jgi:hypothetical protein